MGYTTPQTWTAGQLVDETDLNTEIRDNVGFLANPPAVRALHGSNQSMAHDTITTVTFTATDGFDTDTMHDTSTNPTRITFTNGGLYIVGFHGYLESSNDADYANVAICKNASGSAEIIDGGPPSLDAASILTINISGLYKFAAADYITVYIKQKNTAAAARNLIFSSGRSPAFWAVYQGIG